MTAATRYENAPFYSAVRCPVHQQVVAVIDGKLAGKCDGCAADAARAIRKLGRA